MLSSTPTGHSWFSEPTTGFAPAWSALQEQRLSRSSHVGCFLQRGDRRDLNPYLLLHRQVCTNRVHHGHRVKAAPRVKQSRGLIDECDVSHRQRFVFRVHHDLVPSVQDDCLVIGMTHTSTDEHARVSSLSDPVQMPKFRLTAD